MQYIQIMQVQFSLLFFFLTVKTSARIGQVVATITPEIETEEMLFPLGSSYCENLELYMEPFFLHDRQECC